MLASFHPQLAYCSCIFWIQLHSNLASISTPNTLLLMPSMLASIHPQLAYCSCIFWIQLHSNLASMLPPNTLLLLCQFTPIDLYSFFVITPINLYSCMVLPPPLHYRSTLAPFYTPPLLPAYSCIVLPHITPTLARFHTPLPHSFFIISTPVTPYSRIVLHPHCPLLRSCLPPPCIPTFASFSPA